ncbi:hypothetical protein P175DRAFT_0534799 [Aspergillus ochraceoroseus IBT 24754]|uniref:Uncharacterized protein n=3 Tax=Aspergillus subgen. Nidulantes TaxID=2720870 RepID=A0A0F8ULE0_9EURO|nr:uncharacterized protein P175DRAFT_0534799 [Aspergillus ochraceoroseus IBT 24754]KKK11864.1 hypothetical protein AOCH_001007 [Aspergillus ochraceoroseus]KKK20449.1 hypothetical protein ARAM_002901 [Aspergillus rambellii]PTU19011.1 hypothetical protein P175DRAFT_0534799 [Aspergillus ochraceoroseus IBT 24754]
MSEAPKPHQKEGFMERFFHHHREEAKREDEQHQNTQQHNEHGKEPQHSKESKLDKFKDYMHEEEDLDEAGQTYAGLM